MTDDQGELMAMQAGTAQRLAEVLVLQLRAARFDRAADLMAERERLETLADLLVIATTATRQMANGHDYGTAQRLALAGSGPVNAETRGGERSGLQHSPVAPHAADLGLRRDQIHEARRIRDAERADPGAIDRAIDARMAQGEAPTRAFRRWRKRRILSQICGQSLRWVAIFATHITP